MSAHNNAAYIRSREETKLQKTQMERMVSTGKMTQDEMDAVMISRLHGHYRAIYQREVEARKRRESEVQLQVTIQYWETDRYSFGQLVFKVSRDLFIENMKDGVGTMESKEKTLASYWEMAKYYVLRATRPNSTSLPPYLSLGLWTNPPRKSRRSDYMRRV